MGMGHFLQENGEHMTKATTEQDKRTFEPPLTKKGSPLVIGDEGKLAAGVKGYAIKSGSRIMIPLIIAEKEGSGDVGRFLDALSPRCVIPNVTSPRLKGMLKRRGFKPRYDGEVDIWERE